LRQSGYGLNDIAEKNRLKRFSTSRQQWPEGRPPEMWWSPKFAWNDF